MKNLILFICLTAVLFTTSPIEPTDKSAENSFNNNIKVVNLVNKSNVNAVKPSALKTTNKKTAVKSTKKAASKKKTVTAEKLIKKMSLKEKVGQLFIIRPESLDSKAKTGATKLNDRMIKSLDKYHIGGIIMFSQNITGPKGITKFNKELQKNSKIKLFIGIDEEGGSVARIANSDKFNVKKFKSMQDIGKTGNSKKAKKVGVTIGDYLKKYGFNLDFAPVADVNTNPKNIVIGKRAFGSDPNLVAKMVSAEIKGLHESKIMSCVKHFPGHGDTKGDTHKGYVAIDKTWKQLKKCELIPFKKAFSVPTDMVMVAHITAKKVTNDNLPASLSHEMITNKLRGELGYEGVVITDAMEMGAIANNYSAGKSALKSIKAGADIILIPSDFKSAYNAVYNAAKSGSLSKKRLDKSVLRILKLKEKYGLLK